MDREETSDNMENIYNNKIGSEGKEMSLHEGEGGSGEQITRRPREDQQDPRTNLKLQ
ncbi:unnamed protein product [Eruca vesicaria subsp. sativa]|uniref:Uncharacterized protein n=1 Tax=Eruca vesicaria subsp. sativa TaxID=29727 RepID=A0ABC8IRT5_ERUVS|nr:unnamed protein product [Eruca vesicaria subsp. sativa]